MTAAGHYMKALTFALQGEIFAIDAEGVREILDLVPITEVPSAPDFANGLINVRGRVVPLADLRVTFGMERPEPDTDTRIVVIEIELGGEPAIVGILADKVHDVADIETSAIAQGRHALAFGLCPRHRQAQRRLHHHPPKPAMSMPRLGAVTGIWPRRVAFAQLKGRYTMASERALHDQYSGLPVNVGPKQPDVSAPEFDLDDIFL